MSWRLWYRATHKHTATLQPLTMPFPKNIPQRKTRTLASSLPIDSIVDNIPFSMPLETVESLHFSLPLDSLIQPAAQIQPLDSLDPSLSSLATQIPSLTSQTQIKSLSSTADFPLDNSLPFSLPSSQSQVKPKVQSALPSYFPKTKKGRCTSDDNLSLRFMQTCTTFRDEDREELGVDEEGGLGVIQEESRENLGISSVSMIQTTRSSTQTSKNRSFTQDKENSSIRNSRGRPSVQEDRGFSSIQTSRPHTSNQISNNRSLNQTAMERQSNQASEQPSIRLFNDPLAGNHSLEPRRRSVIHDPSSSHIHKRHKTPSPPSPTNPTEPIRAKFFVASSQSSSYSSSYSSSSSANESQFYATPPFFFHKIKRIECARKSLLSLGIKFGNQNVAVSDRRDPSPMSASLRRGIGEDWKRPFMDHGAKCDEEENEDRCGLW